MRGKFIVFEGIDGSGKTTQAECLWEYVSGFTAAELTSEPTDGEIGRLLRRYLSGELAADNSVLAALFAADRLDHITNKENGLEKTLADGKWVISDRYYLSSFAYQGAEVGLEWVESLNSRAQKLLRPDLQIFIDVPPELAMERIRKNRRNLEVFEKTERLSAVREAFLAVMARLPEENIVMIDGTRTVEEIHENIKAEVELRFGGEICGE